ncbi:hypothetical protein KV097_05180 [Mumia sp. zg.B17]|uniref:hypothetical protein n=1 Tax=unclassified Mumia TaxID=2621872 RepID=UPI001C6E5508|nr:MULTISPECIES: hypothetical protein [unclassified Mumia]MBW9205330.1 hypothetical protein [Mumia sp. zg.B17]MBW9208671.1 hypothetical protein [Mumia sp. zg.B21]MDD9348081.1 hypothetical protein [Mumia sp.]
MKSADGLTLDQEILSSGCLDWVDASEVIGIARNLDSASALDPADLRDLCIGVIARLSASGLIEIGELGKDSRFVPWDGSEPENLRRLAREWARRADPYPQMWDLFWLNTTPRGDEIGNAITDWVNADPETRGPAPSVDPAR